MAKDGTIRGGKRAVRGDKRKPAYEKLVEGKTAKAFVLPESGTPVPDDLAEPCGLVGEDMPDVEEYMNDAQHDGFKLRAADIFRDTWKWIKDRGADAYIDKNLVNRYAMNQARWIQAEQALSKYGLLAKHPTTGQPIPSPFASMSNNFTKLADAEWYTIFSTVKENCTREVGPDPRDSIMASLLTM